MIVMGKWVAMVHMDIKIAVMVEPWKMEGLTEKQVRSVFGQFMTVTMHGRGNKFTVKHFCEMDVHANKHNIILF